MPLSVGPVSAAPAGQVRGLRLALVCYGGVSLAIYMHGITRELQSLVSASDAYECDQLNNPFARDNETAHAYWNELKAKHEREDVRTRIVVDVIAGTSAGGINGIFLAKALARDASQKPLRDVWLNKGDVSVLIANPVARRLPGLGAKAVGAVLGALAGHRAPLSGKVLLEEAYAALQKMNQGSKPNHRGGDWPIELHVTLTDFHGYPLSAPAWNPRPSRTSAIAIF